MLNKCVCIGTQERPKDARVRHEWVLTKKNSQENCLTFRQRVISPQNVILEVFQSFCLQKYRLETKNPE